MENKKIDEFFERNLSKFVDDKKTKKVKKKMFGNKGKNEEVVSKKKYTEDIEMLRLQIEQLSKTFVSSESFRSSHKGMSREEFGEMSIKQSIENAPENTMAIVVIEHQHVQVPEGEMQRIVDTLAKIGVVYTSIHAVKQKKEVNNSSQNSKNSGILDQQIPQNFSQYHGVMLPQQNALNNGNKEV
ncbi:MAG: hypothetical protein ACE5RP_00020 [Nitrosopumilus sp.]